MEDPVLLTVRKLTASLGTGPGPGPGGVIHPHGAQPVQHPASTVAGG